MTRERKDLPANCPLIGTEPANQILYRLVKTDPPCEISFKRWMDDNPRFAQLKKKQKKEWCKCHATSFDSNIENLIDRLNSDYTKMHKKYCGIAKGSLSPDQGDILQTGKNPSHFSFWKLPDVEVHNNFQVVYKGGQYVT